jgi:hypothetical protein
MIKLPKLDKPRKQKQFQKSEGVGCIEQLDATRFIWQT